MMFYKIYIADDQLKNEICFSETLVISCGHYEGDIEKNISCSYISSKKSSETELIENNVPINIVLPEPLLEEKSKEDEDEYNDFHFFFFPDCNKTQAPRGSNSSILIVNGIPKINSNIKAADFCTCSIDKKGKCKCFAKISCECGAKIKSECTCDQKKEMCICNEALPAPKGTCKSNDICLCTQDKDNNPYNIGLKYSCAKLNQPCVCDKRKYPLSICPCDHKPTNSDEIYKEIEGELKFVKENYKKEEGNIECNCQQAKSKQTCFCLMQEECICKENTCICDFHKPCICDKCIPNESDLNIPCIDQETNSISECPLVATCMCTSNSDSGGVCKCFSKEKNCTCGNPSDCKCFQMCDCTDPCLCDAKPETNKECTCLEKTKEIVDGICTCPHRGNEDRKLRRVKVGKNAYRWCHDVDPRHTFFDYAYGRHDKISHREKEKEKLKIFGIHADQEEEKEFHNGHEIKPPPYERKVRKPSIDCCSAVGAISISVEVLGEDKDKFLVQVVSHSSKEGAKTGSKLVSIMDCNLHTMEENRSEHIANNDTIKERRSFMAICENGYYNKITRICSDKSITKRLYHSFEDARNFLLEGANVVLLRYLGLRRYKGTIRTDTVLMNGSICQSIYVSNGVSQAVVNGKPLYVVKVERHIIEPSGFVHQTLTVLTLRGYMVSHEWADSNYYMHLNPLLRVIPEEDRIEEHAPLREKWREDLQLLSDYLDFKSTRTSEGARYCTENGSLTSVVRDYLQALLLLQPSDAMNFTRNYFGEVLSALDLPYNDFFEPSTRHVRYFFIED